jgi:predicted metal-dependent peptidase
MNGSVQERLSLAMAGLFNAAVFDAAILATMKIVASTDVPTAATDCHTTVWYNPEFFGGLSAACMRTVLAHEGRHKVFMHAIRRGDRDPRIWNYAGDYIINRSLAVENHDFSAWKAISLDQAVAFLSGASKEVDSKGIMLDRDIPEDATTESVYDVLAKADENGKAKGKMSPEWGDDIDFTKAASAMGSRTPEEVEREVLGQVITAAQMAKAVGKIPASVARLVADFEKPRVNWKKQLRRFMVGAVGPKAIQGDWSYQRPSRRHQGAVIMPSLRKQPSMPLVIVADSSGSIGQAEMNMVATEIRAIIKTVRPSVTHVLYVDTKVARHEKFTPDDKVQLNYTGGGGTDLPSAYGYIEAHKIKPACCIILTDMMTPFGRAPRFPVIWVSTGSKVPAPYGKTIVIGD